MPELTGPGNTIPAPTKASKGRILVIDDEADIRESLETLLDLEGYQVELAENGNTAWPAWKPPPTTLFCST